jgi:hypothetical protein
MIEDDIKEELIGQIVDGMIAQMTFEDMRQNVWNTLYEDLIWQEWSDIVMLAEEYCPEALER